MSCSDSSTAPRIVSRAHVAHARHDRERLLERPRDLRLDEIRRRAGRRARRRLTRGNCHLGVDAARQRGRSTTRRATASAERARATRRLASRAQPARRSRLLAAAAAASGWPSSSPSTWSTTIASPGFEAAPRSRRLARRALPTVTLRTRATPPAHTTTSSAPTSDRRSALAGHAQAGPLRDRDLARSRRCRP